jgi:hypothetical protein
MSIYKYRFNEHTAEDVSIWLQIVWYVIYGCWMFDVWVGQETVGSVMFAFVWVLAILSTYVTIAFSIKTAEWWFRLISLDQIGRINYYRLQMFFGADFVQSKL